MALYLSAFFYLLRCDLQSTPSRYLHQALLNNSYFIFHQDSYDSMHHPQTSLRQSSVFLHAHTLSRCTPMKIESRRHTNLYTIFLSIIEVLLLPSHRSISFSMIPQNRSTGTSLNSPDRPVRDPGLGQNRVCRTFRYELKRAGYAIAC